MALKPADVEARTEELVHGVQDVLGTVVPESLNRARAAVDDAAHEYRQRVPALQHDLSARAQQLERRATKLSKRLPVDTALDRRRRRRNRRRAGTVLVMALGIGGVVGYAVWRARRGGRPSPAEQPPDPRAMDAAGPGAPARDGGVPAGSRRAG